MMAFRLLRYTCAVPKFPSTCNPLATCFINVNTFNISLLLINLILNIRSILITKNTLDKQNIKQGCFEKINLQNRLIIKRIVFSNEKTILTFMLSNIYFLCNILYIKVYNIHHFNIRLIIHQSPYSISALLCLLGLKQ